MKKFLFTLLLAAAVAGGFTFVLAEENQGEEKKFVIHGEIRQRADFNDNFTDASDDISDSFLIFPYRARIGAEGHFGKNVVGYAEFQTFGAWGDTSPVRGGLGVINPNIDHNYQNTTTNGEFFNNVQLYEGWIALNEIGGSKFSLKVGRQELVKGSEMLLGDLDFYNGVSHDGLVGCFDYDSIDLDVWWTRPLQHTDTIVFDPGPPIISADTLPSHASINFYGAWADFKKIPKNIGVSAYLMYFEVGQTGTFPDGSAFYTIGGRAHKNAEAGKNGFAWSAEIAFQTGEYTVGPSLGDTNDLSGTGFEGMFGYNLHTGDADHLFRVFVAQGSGDDTSTLDEVETFTPMFQDFHGRYGLADLYTLNDLTAMSLGWSMQKKDHGFGVDLWSHQQTEDVLVAGVEESDLDTELDAWWKFQYNPNAQIMAGLAYVMPGDLVKAALGTDDTAIRLVGNLRLRF